MPNHITNCLEIKHDNEEKIEWLLGCFEKETLDFEKIVPPPENMFRDDLGQDDEDECRRKGIPNWRDWQIEFWGTKWNAYNGKIVSQTNHKIACRFDTAWSPPMPIFEALEKMGFEITGLWKDEGCDDINEIGENDSWCTNVAFDYYG